MSKQEWDVGWALPKITQKAYNYEAWGVPTKAVIENGARSELNQRFSIQMLDPEWGVGEWMCKKIGRLKKIVKFCFKRFPCFLASLFLPTIAYLFSKNA